MIFSFLLYVFHKMCAQICFRTYAYYQFLNFQQSSVHFIFKWHFLFFWEKYEIAYWNRNVSFRLSTPRSRGKGGSPRDKYCESNTTGYHGDTRKLFRVTCLFWRHIQSRGCLDDGREGRHLYTHHSWHPPLSMSSAQRNQRLHFQVSKTTKYKTTKLP